MHSPHEKRQLSLIQTWNPGFQHWPASANSGHLRSLSSHAEKIWCLFRMGGGGGWGVSDGLVLALTSSKSTNHELETWMYLVLPRICLYIPGQPNSVKKNNLFELKCQTPLSLESMLCPFTSGEDPR